MITRFKACIHVLIIGILIFHISTTQSQGMLIGERISDFELKHMLNYKSDKARLTDFTGNKALLIDFWFSSCSSCIESFPKLDSIQKEFKNDLNVLLVTFETKEKAVKTFNTIKKISHIKLPSVLEDTLLHLVFPHTSAPHEIWIDKNGKIKAITDHTSINRENIRSLITGEELNLPVKKDNMEYSFVDPVEKTADWNKMIKSTFLSTHQPGLPALGGIYIHPETGFLRVNAVNVHFQSLYILAYDQWGKSFNYNRFIIDKNILERFKEKGDNKNVFCYDGWWRDTTRVKACSEMQEELDRYFHTKSYSEKRKIPCIILKENGIQKRYKSVNPSARTNTYSENDTLYLENVYLKYLIYSTFNYGQDAWSPFQFIDETGYEGPMSIKLPEKFETITQVNSYLKNLDLEVTLEERWLDVIIITEAKKS